ncbi:MAG: GNAT family N-acetyltransferase [Candidatus Micrarchaeales archaeon]|jgi:ribosomal protein S18 acetylase RimI-like enzyme
MVVIRSLTRRDDISDLLKLTKEFYKEYELHHKIWKVEEAKTRVITNFFHSAVRNKDEKAFVALDGKRMVGYVLLEVETRKPPLYKIKKAGFISLLMVDKEYRKLGIADRLIKSAKKWFEKKGICFIYLETSILNRNAMRLYSKNGFEPVQVQLVYEF